MRFIDKDVANQKTGKQEEIIILKSHKAIQEIYEIIINYIKKISEQPKTIYEKCNNLFKSSE